MRIRPRLREQLELLEQLAVVPKPAPTSQLLFTATPHYCHYYFSLLSLLLLTTVTTTPHYCHYYSSLLSLLLLMKPDQPVVDVLEDLIQHAAVPFLVPRQQGETVRGFLPIVLERIQSSRSDRRGCGRTRKKACLRIETAGAMEGT